MTYIAIVLTALFPVRITGRHFFAVCTVRGLFRGRVCRSLPHFKHTITGLPALGALCISLLAPTISGTTV